MKGHAEPEDAVGHQLAAPDAFDEFPGQYHGQEVEDLVPKCEAPGGGDVEAEE